VEYVVQPLASVRCVMRRICVLAFVFLHCIPICFSPVCSSVWSCCSISTCHYVASCSRWGFCSCPFIQFKFFSIAFQFVSPPPVLVCEVTVALQHEIVWLPASADRCCSAHLPVCWLRPARTADCLLLPSVFQSFESCIATAPESVSPAAVSLLS